MTCHNLCWDSDVRDSSSHRTSHRVLLRETLERILLLKDTSSRWVASLILSFVQTSKFFITTYLCSRSTNRETTNTMHKTSQDWNRRSTKSKTEELVEELLN
jgi:hypothetical protein